jgi:hypothetical protein
MKLAAVTMVYNEALILPYFLRFYDYLDEIHVIYETDSDDNTLELLKKSPNVVVHNAHIETGNDAIEKIRLINSVFHAIEADWVYSLDPDEFIFAPLESPRDFLQRQNHSAVRAAMYQVYRHRTETDLDPTRPILTQRLHGDRDVFSTLVRENRDTNAQYIKPIVVRPSPGLNFSPGKHNLEGQFTLSPQFFLGAHWAMADQHIATTRRLQIKARQSQRQLQLQMGWQHNAITPEWIQAECARHLDDPLIEELLPVGEDNPPALATLRYRCFLQEAAVVDLRRQVQGLAGQVRELGRTSQAVTASPAWWAASRLNRWIDRLLPPNSRRRRLAKRLLDR